MKKWQLWTILVIALVAIAAGSVGAYFWLTRDNQTTPTVEAQIQSREQKELEEVKGDLEASDDLDTGEVDDAVKEIESVDLTGV